jgi:hypothetical protein
MLGLGWNSSLVENAAFLLPVISVLAVSALPIRRKVFGIAMLLAAYLASEAPFVMTGTGSFGGEVAVSSQALGAAARAGLHHAFRLGLPLAILVLMTSAKPSSLWEAEAPEAGACPVCGKRKAGLEAHVRDAHGVARLRELKAAGRL